jgi:anti-sigma factor RsiW
MKCQDCIDFLCDYLDESLPPEQAEVFRQHLEKCSPCVSYLETYKKTLELGKAVCQCDEDTHEIPEELVQAILSARRRAR